LSLYFWDKWIRWTENEIHNRSSNSHHMFPFGIDTFSPLRHFLLSTIHLISRIDCDSIYDYLNSFRFFRRRDAEHSQKLNETYKKLRSIKVEKNEQSIMILKTSEGVIVEDLPYFIHAISHLDKYNEIYTTWIHLNNLVGEINSLEDLLKNRIRTEMSKNENYPLLIEKNVYGVTTSNSYSMPFLFEKIFSFFGGQTKEILNSNILQSSTNSVYGSVLGYPESSSMTSTINILTSDNEQDTVETKLIKVLNNISNDNELKQKFENLRNKDMYVKEFSRQMKILSEDIELSHRIKGKCSIGY
jgi:hypothetical protein